MKTRKVVIGISGASGAIYAKLLLEKLQLLQQSQAITVGVVMSNNAKIVWKSELNTNFEPISSFNYYDKQDFNAPFASGSAKYDTMIICPCSMGTLGRIAHGISNDLMTRAADVMLKERRQLILAVRETPFSLIHINNMKMVTEAGAIVCPANPSFYSNPTTIEAVAQTVVDRILDLANFEHQSFRWNDK
ncbi:MAG: UbiX family flavin prenyltransferase [Chitinophagales bacterium]|nr:UbiX family flavin prenyltransferase [Chitinophagales bacterium]